MSGTHAGPAAGGGAGTYERILDALSNASVGDLSSRVEVEPAADDDMARLAHAVNILLADLEHREREREAAQAAVRASELRLRAVLEHLPVGVYVAEHPSARGIYENAEAARILGHPMIRVDHVSEYAQYGAIHEDGTPYASGEYPLVRAVTRGEEIRDLDVLYRRPDGRVVELLINAAPVHDDAGAIIAGVVVFRDVTNLREAERALRAAYAQVEARVRERTHELRLANAELDAFNAMVAHDLRAPLRAVDHLAGVLAHDAAPRLTPDERGHLAAIRTSVDRMSGLIGDLLAFSRAAKGDLAREPVDLAALARESMDALQAREPATRSVRFTLAPDLHARGDPRLLRIVLDNLLSNALKFTRTRQDALIRLDALPGSARGLRAFRLRDNGVGFDPAKAKTLFQPFQRLHPGTRFEGTGVGLATVARIVERHGGTVWAESEPGQGATFYFTLPDAPAPPRDDAPHRRD